MHPLYLHTKIHKSKYVYFHNLSRFDGVLLLKHLINSKRFPFKPTIKEHNIYQIAFYDKLKSKKSPVFYFKDSEKMLPGKLAKLADTLCPELNGKGSIPYEAINEFNLGENESKLKEYLEQDLRILAGVMRKAQEKYWVRYQIDINKCLTVSSMAMRIYRTHYYPQTWPIYRPQANQDTFIRRGYYGGHTDVYKPYGKSLYYYDVNPLYPYAMTKPMPGGKPEWCSDLKYMDLDTVFGFVEATIECPDTLNIPLLPYRDPKSNTLLFPTGRFRGVYFTEELKMARDIGYNIELERGYLFEKKESPFAEFVTGIYEERKKAKIDKDEAMSYINKILMNSLYGRFGIRPHINISEVCDSDRFQYIVNNLKITPLNDHLWVVSYTDETQRIPGVDYDKESLERYKRLREFRSRKSSAAVQMSAAITAYARMVMYKYISKPGCFYTDTDSVFLDKPLKYPFEVSSTELGKILLECFVREGIFLAPKSYSLEVEDDQHIVRYKGPAKDLVDHDWLREQYSDPKRAMGLKTEANFKVRWDTLDICQREVFLNLGLKLNTKRDNVYDQNGLWVDTKPKKVVNGEIVSQDGQDLRAP